MREKIGVCAWLTHIRDRRASCYIVTLAETVFFK